MHSWTSLSSPESRKPDPTNPSANRFQYHARGRVVHVDTEGDPRWSWLGLARETNSYRDVIEQQVNFLVRKRLWLQSA